MGGKIYGIAAIAGGVVLLLFLIAYTALSARTDYLEQRNLRALDRVASEMEATRQSLASAATLHFVPDQLHFSLTPQFECLVATTEVKSGGSSPLRIQYYFVEPAELDGRAEELRKIAVEASEQGDETRREKAIARARLEATEFKDNPCTLERPFGKSYGPENVYIGQDRILLERTVALKSLLWPITTRNFADAAKEDCGKGQGSLRGYVEACLAKAAVADMKDYGFTNRAATDAAITTSLDSTFRNNVVRINASTRTDALDLDSTLEIFDAVLLIGAVPQAGGSGTAEGTKRFAPQLMFQAGHLPPVMSQQSGEGLIAMLEGAFGIEGEEAEGEEAGPRDPGLLEAEGGLLIESAVGETSDLKLFTQRKIGSFAGLHCPQQQPCQLVGVVSKQRFDAQARRLDGGQATVLLVVSLTFLGAIPIVHLALRKRLDPIGHEIQFATWFSLTMLAASAVIASLALWSAMASRHTARVEAEKNIEQVRESFSEELGDMVELVVDVNARLDESDAVYPAPSLAPKRDNIDADGSWKLIDLEDEPDLTLVKAGDAVSTLDTISRVREDGLIDPDMERVALSRFPSFGVNLSDRHYLRRAKNRQFGAVALESKCPTELIPLLLDRVFTMYDGAPRTVMVMPLMDCFPQRNPLAAGESEKVANVAPGAEASGGGAPPDPAGPGDGTGLEEEKDEQTEVSVTNPEDVARIDLSPDFSSSYDPTGTEFLLATASLRTFILADFGPGLSYAVVDPHRPRDEPNILFHSDKGSELVERFEREVDAIPALRAAQEEIIGEGRTGRGRQSCLLGDQPAQTPEIVWIDTHYRSMPAGLGVTRLHPCLDWVLVAIEHRNHPGFAIWRGASLGYATWFLSGLFLLIIPVVYLFRNRKALDRRPGMWLWPNDRLADFTPYRFTSEKTTREALQRAAVSRNQHILLAAVAAFAGVLAAEGVARVLFAFAAVGSILASRAYFRGLTAWDESGSRKLDRLTIMLVALPLALAMGLMLLNGALGRALAFFVLGALPLATLLFIAFRASRSETGDHGPRIRFRGPGWTWIVGLLVMGGVPAMAGYLDSHDYDRTLVDERAAQGDSQRLEERQEALAAIKATRLLQIEEGIEEKILGGNRAPRQAAETGTTFAGLAMDVVNLRERAIAFSDYSPYGLDLAPLGDEDFIFRILLILLPVGLLIAVLLYFQRQYFRDPPVLSPGKDPQFDPPLSIERGKFVDEVLLPATLQAYRRAGSNGLEEPPEGGEEDGPEFPFEPAPGRKYAILGLGLDIRSEVAASAGTEIANIDVQQSSASPGLHKPEITWVDLLAYSEEDAPDIPDALRPGAVVIGNLDIALQLTDRGRATKVFEIIRKIVRAQDPAKTHIFLLADIDPMDRILLLRDKHSEEGDIYAVDELRWAELLQNFTLYPIAPPDMHHESADQNEPLLLAVERELTPIQTRFAQKLRTSLQKPLERMRGASPDGQERMKSYITEQLSDYYYKLWASSSDEERVILYRVANFKHLKMDDMRALRSLLARGLLVRAPEYRLMNNSFAHYVRRVESEQRIRKRAEETGGVDTTWQFVRIPLYLLPAALLLLLLFIAPTGGSAIYGSLPALLAALPALLTRLYENRLPV
ncbi:MAG: hypothetical protein ACFBQW_02935 [Sphingomonadaceae bacterium]